MNDQLEKTLRDRISELEEEVLHREEDLATFRRELTSANAKLETLIGEFNKHIKIAHSLQKFLVPTELPHIQGFEFSSKFVPSFLRGGDYFDVFETEDRSRFGVIIASSSGHVMSSLLLSVLLKFTGRMEARKASSPNQMLQLIVDELKPNIQKKDSADIFYGLFDRRQFSLNYSKVGHVMALHYDYASGKLKLLKSNHGPVTADFQDSIASEPTNLNPRDRLIFCTRGVIEAKNLEDQTFGQDRLFNAILECATQGVHEIRNQILFKVQEFTSGKELPSDMTVVVAEVKDQVIKLAKK